MPSDPDPDVMAVADVAAELDPPAPPRDEGMCASELVLADSAIVEWPVVLRCWETNGHLMPHVDKVHGVRWDTSALSLPWPPRSAALIVRELIAAGESIRGSYNPDSGMDVRWDAAVEAAELLPGVRPRGRELR